MSKARKRKVVELDSASSWSSLNELDDEKRKAIEIRLPNSGAK